MRTSQQRNVKCSRGYADSIQSVLNRTEWNRHGVLTYTSAAFTAVAVVLVICRRPAATLPSVSSPLSVLLDQVAWCNMSKKKKKGPVSRSHLRHSIFSLIRLEVTAVLSWRKRSTQPRLKKWQPAGYFQLDWLVLFVARLIEKQFIVILLLGWGWLVIVGDWSACWLYKGDGMEMACTHFQHQSSHSF